MSHIPKTEIICIVILIYMYLVAKYADIYILIYMITILILKYIIKTLQILDFYNPLSKGLIFLIRIISHYWIVIFFKCCTHDEYVPSSIPLTLLLIPHISLMYAIMA